MDVWLIILTVLGSILIVGVNIYIFLMYSHPDDNKDWIGWLGRIIIIAGSCIVLGLVLLLPLDIANSRGTGGGMNIDLLYEILLILYFIFLVFLIPYTMMLYETDEDKPFMARVCRAFCYEIFFIIIVLALSFLAYGAMKEAQYCDLLYRTNNSWSTSAADIVTFTQTSNGKVEYSLPPYLFMMVFWIFFGWFIFVIFGGIGLIAYPLDYIYEYFYRPKPRSATEIAERKIVLRRKCEELLAYINTLTYSLESLDEKKGLISRWRAKKQHGNKENQLKKELAQLENEYEIFEIEENLAANPVWAIVKLFLGCCGFLLSVCLIIQIVFYRLIVIDDKPNNEFLNDLMVFFEFTIARFISSILFTLLVVYVLATVVKGNFKFGMRFLLIMPIHPMKVGRTFINSFLFNLFMILAATPPILHFIVILFSAYMRLTSTAFIFTILIQKQKFFKWFYESNFFFYVYLVFALLTLIYMLFRPQSDRYNLKKMLEERKKISAATQVLQCK